MTEHDGAQSQPEMALPHDIDHSHSDVTGGWLRAATFGAMDGLVSNTALIAGVAASAEADAVVLSGVAGLLAGAFSMALGEYTSVTTANEQIDAEVRTERRAFERHPQAEKVELVMMLKQMGLTEVTARQAADEIHLDEEQAVNVHLVHELGVDPREQPSPWAIPVRRESALARPGLRRNRIAGRGRCCGPIHQGFGVVRFRSPAGLRGGCDRCDLRGRQAGGRGGLR